ncbi:MAG: energy-coupling factor transporter transmembrane component T [Eubacteriales bacterium]|nr:energy-coupling factor transporter transmembrane component T [Eubacteriales bacterium]
MTCTSFKLHPLTKLIAVIAISTALLHFQDSPWVFLIVPLYALAYLLLGFRTQALKTLICYFSIELFVRCVHFEASSPALEIFILLISVIKLFYLPVMAGRFLFKTTDVGTLVTALDGLRCPKALSIPIAVMFRFFPTLHEERRNIQFAMKMRGISLRHPFAYVESVLVPMLTISASAADDIACYAETKALADPCPTVRYQKLSFGLWDLAFLICLFAIGGTAFL